MSAKPIITAVIIDILSRGFLALLSQISRILRSDSDWKQLAKSSDLVLLGPRSRLHQSWQKVNVEVTGLAARKLSSEVSQILAEGFVIGRIMARISS